MFGSLGIPELLIIFAIILVLFGVGRVSKIGGELGKGIRAFRKGIKDVEESVDSEDDEKKS